MESFVLPLALGVGFHCEYHGAMPRAPADRVDLWRRIDGARDEQDSILAEMSRALRQVSDDAEADIVALGRWLAAPTRCLTIEEVQKRASEAPSPTAFLASMGGSDDYESFKGDGFMWEFDVPLVARTDLPCRFVVCYDARDRLDYVDSSMQPSARPQEDRIRSKPR